MQDYSVTAIFYIEMSRFSEFIRGGRANDTGDETGWVCCYGEPRDGRVKIKAHSGNVQIQDREINNRLCPMVKRVFPFDS